MRSVAPGKRGRAKSGNRREQILEAAVRLIGERGFTAVTINEVAQRCGLSNPGLLHYFPTKEALLVAVLADCDRRNAEALTSPEGAEPTTTLQGTVELLRAKVMRDSAQPEVVRLYTVLQVEALTAAHPACAYFRTRHFSAIDVLARSIEPHVDDARSTALQLMAMLSGLENEWLRTGQGFDLVTEWDRAVMRLLPAASGSPRGQGCGEEAGV